MKFRPLKFVLDKAKGTEPFEQRKDALDATQGERLQKRRLSPWDVLLGLSQKRPETSVPNFVLQISPPSSSLEIQTAGKLTLALVGKEGNMNSCQLIWELSLFFPPFWFPYFVSRRPWNAADSQLWVFLTAAQIPAVFMDSPDLITVNEPATTLRSKWKRLSGE